MITPEQFNSIDDAIDEVNLKKVKSIAKEQFAIPEPNDTTIAAINEDRDELESVESVEELFQRLHEEESPEKILVGSKVIMTHDERQEWWRSSELGKRLGVYVGEAE